MHDNSVKLLDVLQFAVFLWLEAALEQLPPSYSSRTPSEINPALE